MNADLNQIEAMVAADVARHRVLTCLAHRSSASVNDLYLGLSRADAQRAIAGLLAEHLIEEVRGSSGRYRLAGGRR